MLVYKWSAIVLVLITLVSCDTNSTKGGASQLIGDWESNCLQNGLVKVVEFTDNKFVMEGKIYSAKDCSGSPYIVSKVYGTYQTRLASDGEIFEIDYTFKDGSKLFDIFSISDGELHFGDRPESLNDEVTSERLTVLSQDEFYFKL